MSHIRSLSIPAGDPSPGSPRPEPAFWPTAWAAVFVTLSLVFLGLALAAGLPSLGAALGVSPGPNLVTGAPIHDAPAQAVVDVAARDNFFDPAVITVTVGTTVRWTNHGLHLHTTTSTQGYWNWGLQPGARYGVRFLSPGVFDYYCLYHPGMTGRVVVIEGPPPPTPPGATPPPTPDPGPAPGGGAIVFDYPPDDASSHKADLFVVEPDGSGRQALTVTTDLQEAQPSWSPDRAEVAFTTSRGDSPADPWGISVLDVATRQVRSLTPGPEHYEPDWKPDGSQIAFTTISRSGMQVTHSGIAVVNADGSGFRPVIGLLSSLHALASPTWSPDGSRIAFAVRSDPTGGDLYVMNADGSGARRLLAHPGWDDIDPAWSPDGRYLAFASGVNRGSVALTTHDIWLVDLTNGRVGTVATHPEWDLRRPAWSPDGRHVVFHARYETQPEPRYALYWVPATGGTVTGPLTHGVEPDWGSGSLLPTPTGEPFPTASPITPPPPPPFPTFPSPDPTEPTPEPPPTFPPPEPTPTTGGPPTATATPVPSLEPTPTGILVPEARIMLPITYRDVPAR